MNKIINHSLFEQVKNLIEQTKNNNDEILQKGVS